MSSEPKDLAGWIRALFAALEKDEPHSAAAIARIAGERSALIGLDGDAAHVRFQDDRLRVRKTKPSDPWPPPWGRTDSGTVAEILLGYREVSDAISEGLIDLQGAVRDVMDICAIIEILVDASTRIPPMQKLSDAFLARRWGDDPRARRGERRRRARDRAERERGVLLREGLL